MLLDFAKIPVEPVANMRGGQGTVLLQKTVQGPVKVMRGVLPPGATIGMHSHETNCEVIYILSGTGQVLCDGVQEPLGPGACHYCPKGHGHSLQNTGPFPWSSLLWCPRHHNPDIHRKERDTMSDCLFCKNRRGEIPSQKVYEDELVYAFYDIDPQAPTHFLVIPKAHIASCGEITAENSAVVAHCFEVISKVTKDLGIAQFRVVSNCGEQAGQSVFHLHFHVLAGRDMTWPPG